MTKNKNNAAEQILVIKLGALGDFIQAIGPMRAIRDHHKDAKITLLTTAPFARIGRACGYFDDIWVDERPRFFEIKKWLELRKRLNANHFTRVYDLQNNDRTALYFKLFFPRPEWVGAAKGASHRNNSPLRTAGQAYDGHVQTLNLVGIDNIKIDTLDWAQGNSEHPGLKRPYILFTAGSAPIRKEKRWPAEKYGRLAQLFHGLGYQPVLIGTIAEIDVNHVIKKACPEALDLTAKTSLFDLVALARGAASAVGNDTGPMHIITPTGCPSIVLFSRHSNPERNAPQGESVKIIFRDNLKELAAEDVLKIFAPVQSAESNLKTMH